MICGDYGLVCIDGLWMVHILLSRTGDAIVCQCAAECLLLPPLHSFSVPITKILVASQPILHLDLKCTPSSNLAWSVLAAFKPNSTDRSIQVIEHTHLTVPFHPGCLFECSCDTVWVWRRKGERFDIGGLER